VSAAFTNPPNKRVFIAGATGAIGRILCKVLLADGWQVTGTTRKPESAQQLEASGIVPVIVDAFDAEALRAAVLDAQPLAVIHQLTDLPQRFDPSALKDALPRNALLREVGTRNLVDACAAAGVRHLIAQSIAFAYAPGAKPYSEEDPLNLHAPDPAAARTARAVQTLESLVLAGPFRGVVLRYGRLYGPGTWTTEPPAGGPLHVEAAADAARRALERGGAGIYNVAEPDGTVRVDKAMRELGWSPGFRVR
jgi:nucleoside-diphosphate-sugar epimerase